MIESEVELLSRAHQMFAGSISQPTLDAGTEHHRDLLQRAAGLNDGLAHGRYQLAVDCGRQRLRSASRTDDAAAGVIASAHRDHAQARDRTKSVLDEARADAAVTPVTPMAQREAVHRRVGRLRAQRAHVLSPARGREGAPRNCARCVTSCCTNAASVSFLRRAAAPQSPCGPRCHDSDDPMSGARPGPTDSTVPGWFSGPTRRPACTSTAPRISKSTTGSRSPVRKSGWAISSFRTPATCSWPLAATSLSRHPTPVPRCEYPGWATMLRFADRYDKQE